MKTTTPRVAVHFAASAEDAAQIVLFLHGDGTPSGAGCRCPHNCYCRRPGGLCPKARKVEQWKCNHPNECPSYVCACPPGCFCRRKGTCRGLAYPGEPIPCPTCGTRPGEVRR